MQAHGIGEDSLNPRQREAVAHLDGPLLILAGAGSGKTRVITHRIAALVARGTSPSSILALTFTNKAAREMRERAERLAPRPLHGTLLCTFHAFCARWLRRHGHALGLDGALSIYDDDDQTQLLRRLVQARTLPHDRESLRGWRDAVEGYRRRALTPAEAMHEAVGRDAEERASLFAAYEEALRGANAVDFGGLIAWTVQLLEQNEALRAATRERFGRILVDEFQDTDAAQYRLLKALCPPDGHIAVVGDDDQSIYGWRGASVENIHRFQADFPGARVIALEENYRSTPEILDAAHAIVAPLPERMPKRLFTDRGPGEKVRLFVGRTDREEADYVAQEVHRLVREEGRSLSDMAVFYRTNAQSRVLEERLRATGTAHALVGGVSFYARREVKDLLAYLRLAVNPRDDEAFLRVVNTPSRGIGEATLRALDESRRRHGLSLLGALAAFEAAPPTRLNQRTREGLRVFRDVMATLERLQASATADELLRVVLAETHYLDALTARSTPEDADRVLNVQELCRAAEEFVPPEDALSPTAAFLEATILRAAADDVLDAPGAVQLMTVHMSKGLEFPIVFVTGLEDGRFPLAGRAGTAIDEAEERRLFYVAATRARDRLFLTAAAERRLHGQVRRSALSPFVQELPQETLVVDPQSWQSGHAEGGDGAFRSRDDRPARQPPHAWDEFDQRPAAERLGAAVAVPPDGVLFDERYYPTDADRTAAALVGRRARHKLFGTGTITAADLTGPRTRVTIAFPDVGDKSVILDYVEVL